jgi:hypothetical protein
MRSVTTSTVSDKAARITQLAMVLLATSRELASELNITDVPARRPVKPLAPVRAAASAIVAPAKRTAPVVVTAKAPTRRPVKPLAPVAAPVKRTRQTGAADRIVAALKARHGVLASELSNVAGYACGPAVLDRLAATRDFTWTAIGEGAKLRYRATANA